MVNDEDQWKWLRQRVNLRDYMSYRFCTFGSESQIASTIGNIIAVVAVLEIHIDKNAVANIQLSIILLGDVPIISIIFNAILRCKPDVSTPIAKINPPRNIIVTLLKYCMATIF